MSTELTGSVGAGQEGTSSQTTGNSSAGATTGTGAATGATSTWRDTLPDDIKGNGAIAQFKDVASLAK
jgi:hypothetical protein